MEVFSLEVTSEVSWDPRSNILGATEESWIKVLFAYAPGTSHSGNPLPLTVPEGLREGR